MDECVAERIAYVEKFLPEARIIGRRGTLPMACIKFDDHVGWVYFWSPLRAEPCPMDFLENWVGQARGKLGY